MSTPPLLHRVYPPPAGQRTQGRPRRPFARPSLDVLPRLLLAACLLFLTACSPAVAVAALTAEPPATATSASAASDGPALPTALPTTTPRPAATTTPPPVAPTATASPEPSATPIREIELLFTGDINPGRCVYTKAKAANDMALPYRPLADLLRGADITIGSLDGSLSDYNPPNPCVETHRNLLGPAEMAEGMGCGRLRCDERGHQPH